MKKQITAVVAAAFFAVVYAGEITVYRSGRDAWIQSRFSQTHDIVIAVILDANERSFIVPRGTDIRQAAKKGWMLHSSGDDYPATPSGLGTLSGNHGSAFGSLVTAPGHGFTNDDSGKVITDSGKRKYVLVNVVDDKTFFMHPFSCKPDAPVGRPVFSLHKNEKLYLDGKEIKFTKSVMGQLRPLNIIRKNVFLVDGKTPLPDRTVVKCRFLDHVFEHDVAAPEEAVKYIHKKSDAKTAALFTHKPRMFYPGEWPDHAGYAAVPVIMQIRNRMRYEDNGAMVNYRTCCYPVSLYWFGQMDMMFGWFGKISKMKYQMFYIPKSRPVEFTDSTDKSKKYHLDFVKGVDIVKTFNFRSFHETKDAVDRNNPPERFIRVTGDGFPEYGIALGYSMITGDTALGKPINFRTRYYSHRPTRKVYPYVYVVKNNKPGLTFNTVSYKQYFAPSNDPDATAFYYNTQGDKTVVYFEAHKALKNKAIKLPAEFAGKVFSTVEKTPSVTLHTSGRVPADGIKIDLDGSYGHIVFQIDKAL